MAVRLGLDRLGGEEARLVRGLAAGLLAHPASVDSSFRHAVDVLRGAGARLVALFGPEHGFCGEAQDMEGVDAADGRGAGPRVFSLYGSGPESLRPTRQMLDGLDVLVVDLQDVGSRYYTFVWTAAMCLEACHEAGVRLLVLDRPNPIAGAVEGAGVEPGFESFVGYHDVATRHGMTIGEVLRLFARDRGLEQGLVVLGLEGWARSMWPDRTGAPWVLPSPNMPTPETALVYPGTCLVEGTNLSEGRGTTRPFELVGAPWLDGRALAARLEAAGLPGCRARPCSFRPTFQKHAGETCGGVQIHVTDREAFLPLRTGVAVLLAAFAESDRTALRSEVYEFVDDRPAIDLLAGGPWLRRAIEAGVAPAEACGGLAPVEAAFAERRRPALIYP